MQAFVQTCVNHPTERAIGQQPLSLSSFTLSPTWILVGIGAMDAFVLLLVNRLTPSLWSPNQNKGYNPPFSPQLHGQLVGHSSLIPSPVNRITCPCFVKFHSQRRWPSSSWRRISTTTHIPRRWTWEWEVRCPSSFTHQLAAWWLWSYERQWVNQLHFIF